MPNKKYTMPQKITSQAGNTYLRVEEIGQGTYSTVFSVSLQGTEQMFAAKMICLSALTEKEKLLISRELEFCQKPVAEQNQFPEFVVTYYDTFQFKDFAQNVDVLCVVMELGMVTVQQYAEMYGFDSLQQIKTIFDQVVVAIYGMHNKTQIHRDVKPDNMLIMDEAFKIKMIDFGFCRELSKNMSTIVGTDFFVHPKIPRGQAYGKEVDIWSLGASLQEMLKFVPEELSSTDEFLLLDGIRAQMMQEDEAKQLSLEKYIQVYINQE